ncbi:hypothetical protein D3C84_869300 [compost metagenome]
MGSNAVRIEKSGPQLLFARGNPRTAARLVGFSIGQEVDDTLCIAQLSGLTIRGLRCRQRGIVVGHA